jgi:hypothetical protein
MARDGKITIEPTLQQTTPDKCRLMKITPNGPSSAPTPFDYVNKRHIRRKYSGTHSGSNPSFANDFPVLPSFIKAWRVVAGDVFDIADPTVADDTNIVVLGLSNGENYIVELEAS